MAGRTAGAHSESRVFVAWALLVFALLKASAVAKAAPIHGQTFQRFGILATRELLNSGCTVQFYDQQKLDHFNDEDTRVFSQRFTICSNYTSGDDPPVVIYIGGESPEGSDIEYEEFGVGGLIRSLGAVYVDLEHRYYGLSYPKVLPDASTENLKYLSSQQALADLRQFILYLKGLVPNQPDTGSTPPLTLPYSVGGSNVVVIGGSYPGALAAWMKLKHGDVISGAISNSAPVLAQVDFSKILTVFADNIKLEAIGGSQECFNFWDNALYLYGSRVTESVRRVPSKLRPCDNRVKRLTAQEVTAGMSSIIYQMSGQYYVDYADPSEHSQGDGSIGTRLLCEVAKKYEGKKGGTWDAIVWLGHQVFPSNSSCIAFDSGDATPVSLEWPVTMDEQKKMAGRMWAYQVCTEFGWLQPVYGYENSPSPWKVLNTFDPPGGSNGLEAYVKDDCAAQFGEGFTLESVQNAVENTNQIYGGRTLQVENVTFINGGLDPWRMFGILPPGIEYFDNCPDEGFTGNSSFCVENGDLIKDAVMVPLGSHCLWMSALTSKLELFSPELAFDYVSADVRTVKDLKRYLGISG